MALISWYLDLQTEEIYLSVLIAIQTLITCFHLTRLRIQYLQSSQIQQEQWFKHLDIRHFSFGILFFAYGVLINRLFSVINVYSTTISSCANYLFVAVIFASLHKAFNYNFILFRMKSQLFDLKFRKYLFVGTALLVVVFEIYFIVAVRLYGKGIATITHDGNQCDFSQKGLNEYAPIYVGFDLVLSLSSLISFIVCLKPKYSQQIDNQNDNINTINLTIKRIRLWSSIAMLFTLISGICVVLINGTSPILLVGDTVVNSLCCVMQFTPINKDLSISYSEQFKVFCFQIKVFICGYAPPLQQNGQDDQKSNTSTTHTQETSYNPLESSDDE